MRCFSSLFLVSRLSSIVALASLVLTPAQAIQSEILEPQKGQGTASASDLGSLPPLLRYKWQPKTSYVYHVHLEADTGVEIETEDGNLIYEARGSDDLGATLAWRGVFTFQVRDSNGSTRPSADLHILNLFHAYASSNPSASGKPNEIQVSAQGIRLDTQGRQYLSRAQAELPLLPLELLPDTPKSTWAYNRDCSVVLGAARATASTSATRPKHPGSRPPPSKINPSKAAETTYPAHEETRYAFVRMEGANAFITRQYHLSTQAQIRGQAALEITGEGQFTFGTALGVPRALMVKSTLVNNVQAEGRSTLITLSYRLLEGAERERALAPPGKSANSLAGSARNNLPIKSTGDAANGSSSPTRNSDSGNVPVALPRHSISDADLDQVLQELRTPEIASRHAATDRITQSEPIPNRREQVVNALKPLLDDMDNGVRAVTVTAIAAWANLDDGQVNITLLHLLTDEDVFIRWATLDALGRRGTPEIAAGVARCLKKERLASLKSLRQMGAIAAPALFPYLRDAEKSLRVDVCRLLKDIGGKSSLPALERAAREDVDAGVRHEALTAIVAIQDR